MVDCTGHCLHERILLGAQSAASAADWWMVWITAVAALGTVGTLVLLVFENKRSRDHAEADRKAQNAQLDLARQALELERQTREDEVARLEADQRAWRVAQARQVTVGEPVVGNENEYGVVTVAVPVRNDSSTVIRYVTGCALYGWMGQMVVAGWSTPAQRLILYPRSGAETRRPFSSPIGTPRAPLSR